VLSILSTDKKSGKMKDLIKTADDVLLAEANAILKLRERLGENFLSALEILFNCKGRVIITGMGKSGLIGKKISATLSSTGTPSFSLHPAESVHGDSGVITKDDVVLAISNSGETEEILQLLPIIKRLGIKMISMTGKPSSTLAQKSDVSLNVSVEKEAGKLGLAPTSSTTAALAMGDAIAIALLEKKGFTAEDFFMFHPSGKLGKGLLYKVEDLMVTGDKLPVVNIKQDFKEAIGIVSSGRLGMAVVIDKSGKTVGVLTDGDIRRAVMKYSDLTNLHVESLMTHNPKIISKDQYAASALKIMEDNSITSLVINDRNNCPEGVIHVHHLLKAGVA